MKRKATIKPTKASLVIGMIVTFLFLLFGIFFFALISGEPESYIGQGFLIFWNLIVLIMFVFYAYSLKNYDKNQVLGNEIHFTNDSDQQESHLSFDEKLRKLESLKNQGLISSEEYESKRNEIMNQKW